jgi:hypothetical protein
LHLLELLSELRFINYLSNTGVLHELAVALTFISFEMLPAAALFSARGA